jgi:hypothetical protein
MHLSASAAGWIAIGAAVLAAAALLLSLGQWLAVRRMRRAQLTVLGDGSSDMGLRRLAQGADRRSPSRRRRRIAGLERVDRRVDDTVSKTAIVRYDAYENSGDIRSASVAIARRLAAESSERDPGAGLRADLRKEIDRGQRLDRPLS